MDLRISDFRISISPAFVAIVALALLAGIHGSDGSITGFRHP